MQKIAIHEIELAKRWGISPKTLQRWRSEGRGPKYLKLSKRVAYPLDEIQNFEASALYSGTWEKASHVTTPHDPKLLSARDVAAAMSLPLYLLTHPRIRDALGVPYVRVGSLIRFKLDEVMAWAKRCTEEMEKHGIEAPAPPESERRSLLQALADLTA